MSSYIRRFTFDPGNDVLLNIESINILDLDPPQALQGIGTGTVMCVGEYEDGPFQFNLELDTPDALLKNMGTLGYTYQGVQANNPSAIARKADNALSPEYWNGNAFVQLNGKQFARLLVNRVNTSVGSVQFTRLPYITGLAGLVYTLTAGQVLQLDVGAGLQSATFNATAATVTGSGAAFGSITSGLTAIFSYDAAPQFTVTFQTGDTTVALAVARINQFAGFTFATNSAGQVKLTGLQLGSAANVVVVGGTALTDLGLTAATTLGTGNVGNIAAVKQSEIQSVIQTAIANTAVTWDSQTRIRISNTSPGTAPYIAVGPGTTAINLGFPVPPAGVPLPSSTYQAAGGSGATNFNSQQGQAIVVSTTLTLPPSAASTLTLGIDAYPNVTTTFAGTENTPTLLAAVINAAFAAAGQPTVAFVDSALIYLTSQLQNTTAAQVRVVSASVGTVLTKTGLALGTYQGASPILGQLPAGTVVQVPGTGPIFVTMQAINFTTTGVFIGGLSQAAGGTLGQQNGPWAVPIRHALDDGSGLLATAGAISQVTNPPDVCSFSVTNLAQTTAALTESQIDAQYALAIASTINLNDVSKQTNLIFSARQSNTIRSLLRSNAITASTSGCYGRMSCIRPPLNTSEATVLGAANPGVQATRDESTIYCYIGSNVFVPLIARRGQAGNPLGTTYTAFTPSGNVDVGSDSLMASICSQLPPEENPGQDTPFTTVINGIELGANVQGFQMADYILFKAAGIAALRVDDGLISFQSGVTSVDPNVLPNRTTIARRRMANYIQDSIANAGKPFGKKLNTLARRRAYAGEIRNFLLGLLSKNNPQFQRIGGFTLDPIRGNTTLTLGQGIYRIKIAVQTLSSMDSIVLETTIGNQVTVQEVIPTTPTQ